MVARILPEAEHELEEAADYYDDQREGLGTEFIVEFRRALDLVLRWPTAWARVARTKNARRIGLNRFPYRLIYQIRDAEVIIVAIAHAKRRATYWRSRLK
jgi:mRNA-degrading endonuclease RelE of RelBE toxin-antitoxin system